MTAIFVSFRTVPPLPLWDQITNSQTTKKKKKKILFLIFPQSGFSCLMLTMMTNYTNHTYNSNNDNISITIILWIHFDPFLCTGSGCSWVKMYMPGLTCGQQTNLKRWEWEDCLGGAEGLFFQGGREWQCRERQTVSGALFNRIQQTDQNKTTNNILSTFCMTDNNTV